MSWYMIIIMNFLLAEVSIALIMIIIGNNCWIGASAVLLKDVHIGDNVIIGAGSVVTKDIPSNCIAAGIPAKVIKTKDNEL